MSVIIPRSTRLPVTRTKKFSNAKANQRNVYVEVFEGESQETRKNKLIGAMEVPIKRGPAGQVFCDITLTMTPSGQVTANVLNECGIAVLPIESAATREIEEWSSQQATQEEDNAQFMQRSTLRDVR